MTKRLSRKLAFLGWAFSLSLSLSAVADQLKVGDRALAAKLPTAMGKTIDVLEYAKQNKKRNLLLVFFRTGNCGICVHQLEEFQTSIDEIRGNNADVLAVSLDDAITMARTAERIHAYPLLLDPDAKTVKAYGVFNPDEKLSRPSLFLIGPDKKILYTYVGQGLSDRPPTPVVLEAVKHYSGLLPTRAGASVTK